MLVQLIKKDMKFGPPLLRRGDGGEVIWLFLIVIILLPIAAFATFTWHQNKFGKLPVYGKDNHRIHSFVLTNQDGNQTSLENYNNKIIVADFFFTHCPSVCPKMSRSIKRVQNKFSNDNSMHFLSFTVDPERDSATQLNKYAQDFGVNTRQWTLLTGDKRELYNLARNSFMIVATDGDGGPNDFIHSEKLVLVDKQRRIRGYYDGTNEAAINKLMNDINKLKHEN